MRIPSLSREDIYPEEQTVALCVETINPQPEDRARCFEIVTKCLGAFRGIEEKASLFAKFQGSPKQLAKRFAKISDSLRRAQVDLYEFVFICEINQLKGGPFVSPHPDDSLKKLDQTVTLLELCADTAEEYARTFQHIEGPPGPTPDGAKTACAIIACQLLECFGGRVTLTAEGPYCRLAAQFYEGLTGTRDRDLERQCRWVFHERKSRPLPPILGLLSG